MQMKNIKDTTAAAAFIAVLSITVSESPPSTNAGLLCCELSATPDSFRYNSLENSKN